MPNLDSSLTTLRAGGWQEWYLGAFVGTAVLTGTVTADAGDQATSLAYTTTTGSSANVKRGYLVRVTTSGGALKGFWRVRASGTLSSTALPITELSAGSVDINSGDLIEVRNVILPGPKVVEADANFKPDGLSAGTNNSAIPPIACAGPHDMGFVDSGQTYRTVTFPGSLSYTVDADSAGTKTYSWSAPTATGSTSSTSASPSFTFPVGEHLVTLTVTDSSNSATWTTYRKVLVYDTSTTPWEVIVESIDSDIENGTSARFRIVENGSLDDLPDGTLVGLFVREYINGTEQSFGNGVSGRSHIKALGYLRREQNANNAEDGTQELSFEIVSPLAFYKELVTAYSVVDQHNTSADAWNEQDDLSVKRAVIKRLRFYTWLTEFHDLTFHSTFDDRDYSAFFLQKSDPVSQANELLDGVDARLTCDRTGSFQAQMRPECIAEGSRSGITTWGTFVDSDRGDYSFEREHWRPIEMVEGRGFTDGTSTSNNQPIFSRWPGLAPGSGSTNTIIERLIADDQSDLNTRLGRRAAWEDGVYFTSTGVLHRAIQGEVTFPGSYMVFDPAYCEYLLLDFDSTTNLREIDLGDHRFIIQRVSFTPDHESGAGEVTVSFRTATNSVAAGVTYVPPQESDNGLPPWTPPDLDFPPFPGVVPGVTGLAKGTGTMAAFCTDNSVYITTDWTTPDAAGGPTWAATDLSGLANWGGGTLVMFIVDAFSPGYTGTAGGAINGWIVTSSHWQRVTDIFGSIALVAAVALTDSTAIRTMQAERGIQNLVAVASYKSGTGVRVGRSTNGTTMSETLVSSNSDATSSHNHYPAVAVSPHQDRVIVSLLTTGGTYPSTVGGARVSTNGGGYGVLATPRIGSTGVRTASEIHVPFQDDSIAYFTFTEDAPDIGAGVSRFRLYKVVGGGAAVDVSPTVSATKYGPAQQFGVKTCDSDKNTVLCVGLDRTDSGFKVGVFLSRDGGSTWTTLVTPAVGLDYRSGNIAGNDRNTLYLWGANGLIAASIDGGTTIESKMGNLSTSGRIVNICGKGA